MIRSRLRSKENDRTRLSRRKILSKSDAEHQRQRPIAILVLYNLLYKFNGVAIWIYNYAGTGRRPGGMNRIIRTNINRSGINHASNWSDGGRITI
jgi:hypothetical protein